MLLPARMVKPWTVGGKGKDQKLWFCVRLWTLNVKQNYFYSFNFETNFETNITKLSIDFQPINTKNKLKLRNCPWPSVRPFATIVPVTLKPVVRLACASWHLKRIVYHMATLNQCHYTVHICHQLHWFRCDDSRVVETTAEAAFSFRIGELTSSS